MSLEREIELDLKEQQLTAKEKLTAEKVAKHSKLLKKYESDINQAEARLESTRHKIAYAQKEYDQLIADTKTLNEDYEVLNSKLTGKLRGGQSKLKRIEQDIKEREAQLEKTRQAVADAEEYLKKQETVTAEFEDAYNQQLVNHHENIDRLEKQKATLEEEIARVRDVITETRAEASSSEEELKALNKRLDEARALYEEEIDSMRNGIAVHQEKLQKLVQEQEVTRQNTEQMMKNVSREQKEIEIKKKNLEREAHNLSESRRKFESDRSLLNML